MAIPQSFLNDIRNRLTLSSVIEKRVKVTRAGREFKACCPFHHEKTPSFTINDDKQFYHCFGCGAHGDVLNFVIEHDHLPFIDAVKMLAADAGLHMPQMDLAVVQKEAKAKDLYALMDEAAQWMSRQLEKIEHASVLDYLEKRGLDVQARETFRVGYAPPDGQVLRAYLKGEGFSDEDMLSVGLLKQSQKQGGAPYIFFRDRVMFPVLDRRGKVLAFGGRILPEHMRPPTQSSFTPPKYINSAETPLFDKGRVLYGEATARPAVWEKHTLIVTEGYMDVIACHSAGFKAAVAPMGTALTDDQILSLWSMSDAGQGEVMRDPVLCFDGDNAGRRAAARACENVLPLLSAGRSVRFAFMPDGEDPDSMIRHSGAKSFQKVLEASSSLFDFLWSMHTAGRVFETPESRAGLSKILYNKIATIQDAEVQRHYKEVLRTRISKSFFKSYEKWGQKRGGGVNSMRPRRASLKPHAPFMQKMVLSEKILLAAILNHPELYREVEDLFGCMAVRCPARECLRQQTLLVMEENPDLDSLNLKHILKTQGFGQEMDDILSESVYVHAAFSRPGALPDSTEGCPVKKWKAIYNVVNENGFDLEMRQGWAQALIDSDEEREGRLKSLMKKKNVRAE